LEPSPGIGVSIMTARHRSGMVGGAIVARLVDPVNADLVARVIAAGQECRTCRQKPTKGTHEGPVGRESASNKALASCRSGVSKPSVNQP
jgi:hypothetical protein